MAAFGRALMYIATGVGVVAFGLSAPAVIHAIGFTTVGVAKGSLAAGIHSGIGNVAAGSGFAFMQSLGTAPALISGLGAGIAAILAFITKLFS